MTTTPARSTRAPTLQEVARAAGVSRSTVSRVMTNHPRVSPEARARVEAAVAELGYVPNRAARSLATRTSGTIALVVREDGQRVFDEPAFSHLVRGASRAAGGTARQPVLLWAASGRADETDRIRDYLVTGHVDGAVLLSVHAHDPLPAELLANGVPVVISGRPPAGVVEVSWVDADNRAGARSATDHLLVRGRRRIGVLVGPADMPVAGERLRGHREALQAAGRPPAPELEVVGGFTRDAGARAMAQLLEASPDVDAVVAASDLVAVGALEVLARAGRRVPDDVAVIGFDDSIVARSAQPALTSVHQPLAAMGAALVELLEARVAGGGPEHRVLPTRLVVREST